MSALSQNNRLTVLAADIRAAHADIQRSAMAMAERAIGAGKMLAEAKTTIPHGRWEAWLRENVGFSERTARRYMQIADSGLKSATVADLGIAGASYSLSRRRDNRPDKTGGFDGWYDDLITTLGEAEKACPGFRAGFIEWAKSQRSAERYAETLLQNCLDDERPALESMIIAERNRTLALCLRRAHVQADHA